MKIKLDDKHYLNSDQYCFWITKETTTSKGTVREYQMTGYHRTLPDCIDCFIDKSIGGADVKTLVELSKQIKDLKKLIRGWKVAVTKE